MPPELAPVEAIDAPADGSEAAVDEAADDIDTRDDADEEDPQPEKSTEEDLRAALDLIKPLIPQIREAHRLAADWFSAAPEIERRQAELIDLEAAARDSFQTRLNKELADAISEVRSQHEAELTSTRSHLEEERERLRSLNDDLSAQLSKAVEREAEADRAKTEALSARDLSILRAESELELQRRQDANRIRSLESELADANAAADAYKSRVQQLESKLESHQFLRLQLGNRDPQELLDELLDLQTRVKQSPALHALSDGEREEFRQLKKEVKNLRKDLDVARREAIEANEQREAKEHQLASLSFQAAATDTYKQMIAQQRAELDELRGRIGELRETYGSPFPSCESIAAEFDVEPARAAGKRRKSIIGIDSIVPALQRRLARDPKKPLRYRIEDLQIAFAGLNASRLHLLQGPSGTGKTSLPVALAEAFGWGYSIVAVQDGWNDRQDLLGYFNTFDQQFQETDFLRALYKAGSPAYKDRPYVIVLDEANLSYIERYFTDFLSRLELDPDKREPLSLAPPGLTGMPPRLENGSLEVPTNVWFVGTANQDATTKEFAPKTIDRAHLLELVRNRNTPVARVTDAVPEDIGLDRLAEWFSDAAAEYAEVGLSALERLEESLAGPLEKLELAPAYRLERYAEDFLPTLRAVGGTDGLGLDHLLTTKVLYPL